MGPTLLLLGLACVRDAPVVAAPPAPAEAAAPEAAAPAETWPGAAADYPWLDPAATYEPLWARVGPPPGYTRAPAEGYAAWLRGLPMLPEGAPVQSYRGDLIWSGDDPRLLGVVALDVGEADLQQCADTILRLRLEWLWQQQASDIGFRFTSGHRSTWAGWARGERPVIQGSKVSFVRSAAPDASRASFERYRANLFTYAGTLSLAREGQLVPASAVTGGDFLVQGGSPGHAVVVLDVSRDEAGHAAVLVGEGFMPAQSMHVLRGPLAGWYPVEDTLLVPTWSGFPWSGLRRF